MSLTDDPKGWAKAQAERLRSDPKGWAKEQVDRARGLVDVAPFSDEALQRELVTLREKISRLSELSGDERVALHEQLIALRDRLSASGAAASGAKIGLAAAVLPVVGVLTGPLIGGAYGVYRSQQLGEVREELDGMIRRVVRG